jgi:enterochelin esterase-like enzyme/outer membrane protein assembly factor BamB
MKINSTAANLLALALVMTPGFCLADDWPGFRGARADGISEAALITFDGPVHLDIAWKHPFGSGYSGIAVEGNRLVTMHEAGDRNVLAVLDADTGLELWRLDVGPRYPGHDGSHDGPITTPLIHDGRVFALGPWGHFVAADLATGEHLWSTHLVEDVGTTKPFYGFGTSPLAAHDGTILLAYGDGEDGAVVGFDGTTGEPRWKAGKDRIGYQSPVPVTLDNREAVLVAGGTSLLVVDPTDGAVLWDVEHGGSGGTGAESLVPVPLSGNRIFLASKDRTSTVWALETVDGNPVGVPVWESGSIRNSYTVPVYRDGYLYAYSSRFLTCVDASTGEPVWKSRQPGDGFHTFAGDYLLIQTKAGSLHLAEASSKEYRELDALDLFDDLSWTPPSVAGGSIFVRSHGEIARVEVRSGAASLTASAAESAGTTGVLARLKATLARTDDKPGAVDQFLSEQSSFPIIEGNNVLFVYWGEAQDVSIAGDMIGARLEEPMSRLEGTDLYHWSTTLTPGAAVSYSFVKDFEQLLDPLNPVTTNDSLFAVEFELALSGPPIEMSELTLPGWVDPSDVEPAPARRRGRLEAHQIETEALGTAALQIYLPAGYDAEAAHRYPVLYVHGGKDAIERGRVINTLDNLTGDFIEPMIAVFADARFSPRMPQAYLSWINETLVPFIDASYPTDATAVRRANFGASFYAYTAMMASFTYPQTFGGVGALSPHMNDLMRRPMEAMATDGDLRDLDIYLDWGTYDVRFPEEALDLVEMLRSYFGLLQEQGYEPVGGEVARGAGWRWWRAATGDALSTLFPTNNTAATGADDPRR